MFIAIHRIIWISAIDILLNYLASTTSMEKKEKINEKKYETKTPLNPDARAFNPATSSNHSTSISSVMPSSSSETYANVQYRIQEVGSYLVKDIPPTLEDIRLARIQLDSDFFGVRQLKYNTLSPQHTDMWNRLQNTCTKEIHLTFPNIEGTINLGNYALQNLTKRKINKNAAYSKGYFQLFETYFITGNVPTAEIFCTKYFEDDSLTECKRVVIEAFGSNAKKALKNAFYEYYVAQFKERDYRRLYMEEIIKTYSIDAFHMHNIFQFCTVFTYQKLSKIYSELPPSWEDADKFFKI